MAAGVYLKVTKWTPIVLGVFSLPITVGVLEHYLSYWWLLTWAIVAFVAWQSVSGGKTSE